MSVKLTAAYWKIKSLKKKIKIIQGGQGASKTYSICILALEKALKNPIKVTIVTETYNQLVDGVVSDMKSIVSDMGISFDAIYQKQAKNLKWFDSEIQFRNVDNKDFHRSKGARRNILFINEANRTNFPSVEQLIDRTTDDVYIDYTPDREFWVPTEMLGKPDTDFIILTYKDNECIDPGEKKAIEAKRGKKDWWRIYGEGQLGVYNDRRILDYEFCDKIPDTAKRINSGMDFGVSPDPTILVALSIDGNNLYCDALFCLNNLMPEKIAGAERMSIVDQMDLIKFPKGQMIIADSSGRVSIHDMRKHQYTVIAIKKYPGSVLDGLNKLRGYNLFLTKRSINLKKGIESFFWKVDKNNKIIPEPDGHEPDGIAAIRYSMMTYR